MPPLQRGRHTAQIEGDFVVFIIGMRINRLALVHKWVPVARAMGRMLDELHRHPELGLLHVQNWFGGRTLMTMQYWRSFDQLHSYAHARNLEHLPAWAEFNRKVTGNGSVGIFHETYMVAAGQYESIYADMPRIGLARAGAILPAPSRRGRASANPVNTAEAPK
jgi:Domain of unknown function (DUF4188)